MKIISSVSRLLIFFSLAIGSHLKAWAFDANLIQRELADPTVFFVKSPYPEQSFYILGGTGVDIRRLPLYRSQDGLNFNFWKNYDPSSLDPLYEYCYLWAPEINQLQDGTYILLFSAARTKKGDGCGALDTVTLFKATATTEQLNFSAPDLFVASTATLPQSNPAAGCIDGITDRSHCEASMRIDADYFFDPLTKNAWIYYVWFGFDGGANNISSFVLANPEMHYTNRRPASVEEENIIEAPDVFYRAPYYYMIFSQGDFTNSYSLSYSFGKNVSELQQNAKSVNPKKYALLPAQFYPQTQSKCTGYTGAPLKSAAGHSATLAIEDKYYLYYHQSVFGYDGSGCHRIYYRDAYRTELTFLPDGRIKNLNDLFVHWQPIAGYEYSFDVKTFDGQFVGPCIGASELKMQNWLVFAGQCADKKVELSSVKELRVCAAKNGNWAKALCSDFVEVAGRGKDTGEITVELPQVPIETSREFSWADLGSQVDYSFDVREANGKLHTPCVGANVLGRELAMTFKGQCEKAQVAIAEVAQVRVCAAYLGQWNAAVCTAWTNSATFDLPLELIWPAETKANIQFAWNSLGSGYTYSLDLEDEQGIKYYPCIHAGMLAGKTTTVFKAQCYNASLPNEKVRAARICAAKNNNWANAKCSSLYPINRVKRSYNLQF